MTSSFLVGLVGEGILESFTPDMHMTEASQFGLDYEYRLIDIREQGAVPPTTSSLLADAVARGYAALNITHPFKREILTSLDELSPDAARIGAANVVLIRDGVLRGENTDWTGFRRALTLGLPDCSMDTVIQYGAGGAGSATAYALLSQGVRRLLITDIDDARASSLALRYGALFGDREVRAVESSSAASVLGMAGGVVQATPVGMHLYPGVPFEVRDLAPDAWVADVVYRPLETELLKKATERGHRVLDGGLMAVGQAAARAAIPMKLQATSNLIRCIAQSLLNSDSALSQIRGI